MITLAAWAILTIRPHEWSVSHQRWPTQVACQRALAHVRRAPGTRAVCARQAPAGQVVAPKVAT